MAHDPFPPGFFDRADETPDDRFYAVDRLVTHIDDAAIVAVGDLYDEFGLTGDVLDICSSWISHFHQAPRRLVAMGMNAAELAANTAAAEGVVQRSQYRPDAAVRRLVVRRGHVLRVGRLPHASARRVRRGRSGAPPGGRLRVYVLQSLLSDQGHPRLVVDRRRRPLRHRFHVLRAHRRLRRHPSRSYATQTSGATRSMPCGPVRAPPTALRADRFPPGRPCLNAASTRRHRVPRC